ncbi:maleylpyruvate isomerase family mycothiol-dependent enzyme [Yinghuangia seranimata]|uniref:maleylpyruvate isomerase family mycothiol-dependent enzyme n=1 Tax=Yinghuangia seranimata TaxID=408067 RepID=UPI00248B47D9|nr:maleylpyruvate isomerase family mycothiol-dependent enzyme [Yinghuangia seranimata]MDI2126281.1 maleylpyruvate isomerase family mycothiol-dependent enzyme [Yinghuangia seranimata]
MTTDGFDPAALVDEMATATAQVVDTAERLTPERMAGPSGLPGWSRAHVLTHLARNADGLANLAHWAATGVVTPMYPPGGARDAAIEQGAQRPGAEIVADLQAASERLEHALASLSYAAWGAKVAGRDGREFAALQLPYKRIRELYIHHVDLNAGWTPAHWPGDFATRELLDAAASFRGRPDTVPLLLHDEDSGRRLAIGPEEAAPLAVVSGPRRTLLAWLIGRTGGDGLTMDPPGALPPLPAWM